MTETIIRVCPHCGKELQVPPELQEFSCLYCGTRSSVAAILNPTPDTPADFAERFAELKLRLPKTVTRYPDYYKRITKKEFFHAFEVYENENRALMRELDVLAKVHPRGVEAGLRELCESTMDSLTEYMESDKRWKFKGKRSQVMFEVKLVLAIFLTPLARKMKLETAERFRTQMHNSWKVRYPKEVWEPGDYEVMASGFKKIKWCYITTATCRSEGKSDDCAELTAFRSFRDGWLTENGGAELIGEYYDKAPGIVACIELCDNAPERYEEIRQRWLDPCYQAISENRMADCKAAYVSMVRQLEERYFH